MTGLSSTGDNPIFKGSAVAIRRWQMRINSIKPCGVSPILHFAHQAPLTREVEQHGVLFGMGWVDGRKEGRKEGRMGSTAAAATAWPPRARVSRLDNFGILPTPK